MSKSSLERKGIISVYSSQVTSVIEELQGRYSRQEPGNRNQNRGLRGILLTGLLTHGLFSLLSYTTHDHLPRSGTMSSTVSWALSNQSLIKKVFHRVACRLI